MISAQQQAELFAPASPAPVAPPDPGPALRLSKSGACARELAYRLHGHAGIPDSPESRNRMDLGHVFEDRVIELMRADGWWIESRRNGKQIEVEIKVTDKLTVTGHIDGLVETPRRAARIRVGDYDAIPLPPMLLEVKSMGWNSYRQFLDQGFALHPYFASYRAQVSAYLYALGLTHALVVAVVRNDRDTFASVRSAAELNWSAEVFERDDALVVEVLDKFARVARSPSPLPELRAYRPNARGVLPKPCTWCPFRDACWGGIDRHGKPAIGLDETF